MTLTFLFLNQILHPHSYWLGSRMYARVVYGKYTKAFYKIILINDASPFKIPTHNLHVPGEMLLIRDVPFAYTFFLLSFYFPWLHTN